MCDNGRLQGHSFGKGGEVNTIHGLQFLKIYFFADYSLLEDTIKVPCYKEQVQSNCY